MDVEMVALNPLTKSPVWAKTLCCVLFLFMNRAHKIVMRETLIAQREAYETACFLPFLVIVFLHLATLLPALLPRSSSRRMAVCCLLLQVAVFALLAGIVIIKFIHFYPSIAPFFSVLLAVHLCYLTPRSSNDFYISLPQKSMYTYVLPVLSGIIPVTAWLFLPVFRPHEMEALVLLFTPELFAMVAFVAIRIYSLSSMFTAQGVASILFS
jgi:hypothetical protein